LRDSLVVAPGVRCSQRVAFEAPSRRSRRERREVMFSVKEGGESAPRKPSPPPFSFAEV